MDKRSWIWILFFFVILFGVNWFFEQQHSQQVKEWQAKRDVYRKQQVEQLQETIQKNTVSLDQLPISSISADASGQEKIGTALTDGDYLFTLNEIGSPQTVYSKGTRFESVSIPNLPVLLFRTKPEADIPSVSLPSSGRVVLQLVQWPKDPTEAPTLSVAESVDGQITVLTQKLKEWQQEEEGKQGSPLASQMGKTALALVKTADGYRVVGLYDATENVLREWSEIPALSSFLETPTVGGRVLPAMEREEEQFFVLENGFTQLVFSNYGGALAEINLPFRGEKNPNTVVKKIEIDRDILEVAPRDSRFPLYSYFTPGKTEPVFHQEGAEGGYYPLLRRDLFEAGSNKKIGVPPAYYNANLVSDYPELAQLVYTVQTFENDRIVFTAEQPYRRIKKTFTLPKNPDETPYLFDLEIEVEGDRRGLWITSGVPEAELISGSAAPALKYKMTRKEKPEVVPIDLPKESVTISSVNLDWISNANGFFGIIIDPQGTQDPGFRVNRVSGELVPSRLTVFGDQYKASNYPGYLSLLPYPSKAAKAQFRFFSGPYDSRILKQVDAALTNSETGENPGFASAQTFHGWFAFISQPFAKFLFFLMNVFHQITGSWGFSIILLTVVLRIMLFPLNAWSMRSMMKMQQIAPEAAAIDARYKNDPKKAQLEKMALYREAKVNPLSGCFPLIIQMPFLIGMFDLLKSSFALRGAPFIPGWIDNLAAPDVVFTWGRSIPFFGNSFHLLPFILGFLFFLQSRLFSNLPKDPSQMTDQQRQQRAMGSMSGVLFTVFFYNFPSGLNIYFISNNLLGMLQQWYTSKQLKKQPIVLMPEKKGKKR